jgi:glyoxylase-like metal-dependent hydrolase (beta-lactamase superfamily II)
MGDEEASGLRAAREQGTYPPDFHFAPCSVDHALRDGEEFEAGGIDFRAIQVRGHCEDAFCYCTHFAGEQWIFTGDVVFYGGVLGVINIAGSGMSGYRADLAKLQGLEVEGLFPGHGMITLRSGQQHIDLAIDTLSKGFLPRQVGQGDLIF